MQMRWQDYESEFEWDGSWRDIYVLNTSVADWQKLLDFLRTASYNLNFYIDGEDAVLPSDVAHIFKARAEVSAYLSVDIGEIILNCHFFHDAQIEFDIDPREVTDEIKFQRLLAFMQKIARLLDKDAILTSENVQSEVILTVQPDST
jgi:hypothetical protein